MQKVEKAFAVREVPLKRFEAVKGPLSSTWTLYDSTKLRQELLDMGCFITQEELDKLLEKNGFNKAVRVRMEVLAWKERLRIEHMNLCRVEDEHKRVLKDIRERKAQVFEQLEQTRNILRLPREANEEKA